jgi:hypothetical protein
MTIRSKNSTKTLAVAQGTLVAQAMKDFAWDNNEREGFTRERCFEADIDEKTRLTRLGPATVLDVGDGSFEYRCAVQYGPVLGAYESDLYRELEKILSGIDGGASGEVFHYTRSEVEDVRAIMEDLAAKVGDVRLSLAARKELSKTLERLEEFTGTVVDPQEATR